MKINTFLYVCYPIMCFITNTLRGLVITPLNISIYLPIWIYLESFQRILLKNVASDLIWAIKRIVSNGWMKRRATTWMLKKRWDKIENRLTGERRELCNYIDEQRGSHFLWTLFENRLTRERRELCNYIDENKEVLISCDPCWNIPYWDCDHAGFFLPHTLKNTF